jgi:tRNA(Arg) A34 adenosine deaminase TadA
METEDHRRFMQMALETARNGIERGQTPFGACIVNDGEVVARAHNTVWSDTDITAHAEVQAIRQSCSRVSSIDLSGSVIYSTCEPCPMCFSACHWARIDTIVYGAEISDAADFGFNEMPISDAEMKERGASPVHLISGVLRESCIQLFETWARRPDARKY